MMTLQKDTVIHLQKLKEDFSKNIILFSVSTKIVVLFDNFWFPPQSGQQKLVQQGNL